MGRLVSLLKRAGLRRGVFGASRGWLGVWLILAIGGFLRKRMGRTEDVVYRTELPVGQRLLISNQPPETAAPDEDARRQ